MSGVHASEIAEAVRRLRAGGVVAFPTETVYGLGADALNESAVRRVYELKGRPANNPLIVHVSDAAMAERLAGAGEWPARARELAARFWPGPLTIVVKKAARVPGIVTAGGGTVALRCPDHPVALELLRAFGGPMVGPSANPSGRISPTTAAHVRAAFDEREVMVLDGGACARGIESTVVSVVDDGAARVLRLGAIGAEELGIEGGARAAKSHAAGAGAGGAPMPSPGMLASHYAPRARVMLFAREEAALIAERARGEVRGVVVLAIGAMPALAAPSRVTQMPREAAAFAARLYAALHEADAMNPAWIAVEIPEGVGGVWDAVRDRLSRAAAERP